MITTDGVAVLWMEGSLDHPCDRVLYMSIDNLRNDIEKGYFKFVKYIEVQVAL